jgi:hypothetical protein
MSAYMPGYLWISCATLKILCNAESGIPPKVCQITTSRILRVSTHTHSNVAKLITIIQIHSSYFFLSLPLPNGFGLGHFERTLFLLRSDCKNTAVRRVADSMQPQAKAFKGPPRPDKHHHYIPIINGRKYPSRTQSVTRGGVGPTSPYTPRAIS